MGHGRPTQSRSIIARFSDFFDNTVVGRNSNMIMGLVRMGIFVGVFIVVGGLTFYLLK